MATRKATITIDAERLGAVHALVAAGRIASMSAFFDHAAAVSLDDIAGWARELDLDPQVNH